MYNIIYKYIEKLTSEDINTFAKSKNINLSEEELTFTYNFIKRNVMNIIKNPNIFNINRIQKYYSKENFTKIKKVYIEYFSKYQKFLK